MRTCKLIANLSLALGSSSKMLCLTRDINFKKIYDAPAINLISTKYN